jgi:hypothetical protein
LIRGGEIAEIKINVEMGSGIVAESLPEGVINGVTKLVCGISVQVNLYSGRLEIPLPVKFGAVPVIL